LLKGVKWTVAVLLSALTIVIVEGSGRCEEAVDRDGIRLPAGAVMRLGTARLRHPGLRDGLGSIAFRPDSRSLATRTERLLRVWSVPDGLFLWECTTENKILEVAFSPDNRWIGIAIDSTGVQVRSAATGRLHTTVGSGSYRAIAFTPDGELLATGRSRPAAIDVWKTADSQRAAELECSERTLDQLAFGRDGRSLRASLSDRSIVRIAQWDVATWQRAHNFDHPELTFQREMSSDGRWFVARQQRREGVLRRWNLDESRELEAFETTASDFVLSGDRWMVTMQSDAGNKTAATIWDVETRRPVKTIDLNLWQGRKARVSPDGATLASVRPGTMVCLWDAGSGRWLGAETGHRLAVQQLAFTRDGRRLISRAGSGLGGNEQSELRVWDLSKGEETNRINTASQPFVVLPGEQELATLHFPLGDLASKPGALFRRIEIAAKPAAAPAEKRPDDARKDDARKLDATARLDVAAAPATGVAQLAEGEWGGYRWLHLAEGGERLVGVAPLQVEFAAISGHRITTWEVKSGRCLTDEVVRERPKLDWVDTSGRVGIGLNREWRPASAQLKQLGFAREYAAQLDQFDLRSGAVSATLKLPDSQRTEFAASRDGRTIAVWLAKQEKGPSSPATDATVQLHSWPDGRLLKKWDREQLAGHDLQLLQLSDDGRWLVAIASGRIDLFDVQSGRLKSGRLKDGALKDGRRNEGRQNDGRQNDGDVKSDERDSGDWQYESRCTAVAIHPNDGTLATGHADGTILVWKPGE
ncbi:MAG TPA: WD40 repeat domain-containing protein, partial [Pirellulaceae bacterium]|nr:WD40 repeat domain-containing protein [Pirellulaceae bacterium]